MHELWVSMTVNVEAIWNSYAYAPCMHSNRNEESDLANLCCEFWKWWTVNNLSHSRSFTCPRASPFFVGHAIIFCGDFVLFFGDFVLYYGLAIRSTNKQNAIIYFCLLLLPLVWFGFAFDFVHFLHFSACVQCFYFRFK